MSRAARARGS